MDMLLGKDDLCIYELLDHVCNREVKSHAMYGWRYVC